MAKVSLVMLLATLILGALAAALAPTLISGPRFGRLVERQLPNTRGVIEIGGGTWTWAAAWQLWRGRAAPFALDDVRLIDPEGTEVFRARRLTGQLVVATGPIRIGVHGLRVQQASWRFGRMLRSPEIGFLAALSPPAPNPASPRSASPRARVPVATNGVTGRAPPPTVPACQHSGRPCFRIFDATLEELNASFVFPEWQLALRDVHTTGALAYDWSSGARPAFAFEVARAEVRGGGQLGIRVGSARLSLPLARSSLNRVATTAANPHAIVVDAGPVAIGTSRATFVATFPGIYGNGGPHPPAGMDAEVRVEAGAGDALQAALSSLLAADRTSGSRAPGAGAPAVAEPLVVGGPDARLTLKFSGPFAALALQGEASGVQVRYRGFELREVGLRVAAQPAAGRARVQALSVASPGGGRADISGELGAGLASAAVVFRRFAVGPFLPPVALPFAAGTLDGVVRAKFDTVGRHLILEQVALALDRPPGSQGPPAIRIGTARPARKVVRAGISDGRIVLPPLTASMWGGRVTVRGSVFLASTSAPLFDLSLDANNIALKQLVGSTFLHGTLSFRARGRGSLQRMAVRVRFAPGAALQLFGERLRLPAGFAFAAGSDGFDLPPLRLQGAHGGALIVAGRVAGNGDMNLVATVQAFPFSQLPAFSAIDVTRRGGLTGRLTGRLRLSRAALAPVMSIDGQLSVAGTTFAGYALGGGSLTIASGAAGVLRARGQVIDGVTMEGTLSQRSDGLAGEATLQLNGLRLEPFLSPLLSPLLFSSPSSRATGLASGTVTARLRPDAAPLVEARLRELALQSHGLEVRAADEVRLWMDPQAGTLRLRTTRFTGKAGTLELGGEIDTSDGGAVRGQARGRLDLGVLSSALGAHARAPRWLRGLSGAVSLDLHGTRRATDVGPSSLAGQLTLDATAPIAIQGTPLHVRVAAGRIELKGDGTATVDVPVTAAGGTVRLTGGWSFPTAPAATLAQTRLALDAAGELDARVIQALAGRHVQGATGRARLNATMRGTVDDPRLGARVGVGGIAFSLPGRPTERVRLVAGQLELDETTAVIRNLQLQVGAATRLTIGASAGEGPLAPALAPVTTGTGAATVRFEPFRPTALTHLDVPVRGDGVSFAARTAVVDHARLDLRLLGDPRRSLRLSGTVDLVKARVSSRLPRTAAGGAAAATPPWAEQPQVQQMQLDLQVRSRGGAVTVELPYAPDVRVDLEYRVGGTPKRPQVSGTVRGAGPYSSVALSLYRLFK